MKKTLILLVIIFTSAGLQSQGLRGLRDLFYSFYNKIEVTDGEGEQIASVSKKSTLTYNKSAYNQINLKSSFFDNENYSWFDVDYNFHLKEKTRELDSPKLPTLYYYTATINNSIDCIVYFSISSSGLINDFHYLIKIGGKDHVTAIYR